MSHIDEVEVSNYALGLDLDQADGSTVHVFVKDVLGIHLLEWQEEYLRRSDIFLETFRVGMRRLAEQGSHMHLHLWNGYQSKMVWNDEIQIWERKYQSERLNAKLFQAYLNGLLYYLSDQQYIDILRDLLPWYERGHPAWVREKLNTRRALGTTQKRTSMTRPGKESTNTPISPLPLPGLMSCPSGYKRMIGSGSGPTDTVGLQLNPNLPKSSGNFVMVTARQSLVRPSSTSWSGMSASQRRKLRS